jgi:hydroxyethylthiazole kinase-like uncharacterized protein yjeF
LSLASFKKISGFILEKKVTALVLGPGLSVNRHTKRLTARILSHIDLPMVIDADGLNALGGNINLLDKTKGKFILTPHLGEFSRLIKRPLEKIKNEGKKLAKEFAFRYNLILVLKGPDTLVTDGNTVFENKSGNPGLATGGSGDVLSGLIAGLIAQAVKNRQGQDLAPILLKSAELAVNLHGLAADIASREKTQANLTASDIIDFLPRAIKKITDDSRSG